MRVTQNLFILMLLHAVSFPLQRHDELEDSKKIDYPVFLETDDEDEKRNCLNGPAWESNNNNTESSGWVGWGWVGDIPTTYIQLAGAGSMMMMSVMETKTECSILARKRSAPCFTKEGQCSEHKIKPNKLFDEKKHAFSVRSSENFCRERLSLTAATSSSTQEFL